MCFCVFVMLFSLWWVVCSELVSFLLLVSIICRGFVMLLIMLIMMCSFRVLFIVDCFVYWVLVCICVCLC